VPSVTSAPVPPLAAVPATPTADEASAPKPKAKRKVRAWRPPRVAPTVASPTPATEQEPSGEANPYDIKLTEDPPAAPKPVAPQTAPAESSNGHAEVDAASPSD
jgi:hypothetical protein